MGETDADHLDSPEWKAYLERAERSQAGQKTGHTGLSLEDAAREAVLSQPDLDANAIRANYDLPALDDDELVTWLGG